MKSPLHPFYIVYYIMRKVCPDIGAQVGCITHQGSYKSHKKSKNWWFSREIIWVSEKDFFHSWLKDTAKMRDCNFQEGKPCMEFNSWWAFFKRQSCSHTILRIPTQALGDVRNLTTSAGQRKKVRNITGHNIMKKTW